MFNTFGACGMSTFQGATLGVNVQMINKHAHFMLEVHCMAHCTNLVVQTLSKFKVVRHVEDLLAILYSYFNFSPKWTLKIQKLAPCLDSKCNKSLGM
jgi:hypothetical protein